MSFIVITGQVVGGNEEPLKTVWGSDLVEYQTLKLAGQFSALVEDGWRRLYE